MSRSLTCTALSSDSHNPIIESTLDGGRARVKTLESISRPRYSIVWEGKRTDFSQLIKNPTDCNKLIVIRT
jgi:hypothetical protein